MDIQVITPAPAIDFNFNFNSTSTSPYITAPSTPHRIGNFFYSEPTSPTGWASSFSDDHSLINPVVADGPQSTIPFNWEEKPGIRKQSNDDNEQVEEDDTDFAFDFSSKLQRQSISAADELFDSGKIKPLKPPPRLQFSSDSPRSPKSPTSRFREALSPRAKKKDFDPFSEAFKQTSRDHTQIDQNQSPRGRERSTTTTRRKVSRSVSPFRTISDEEPDQKNSKNQSPSTALTWYNKWNLKNLLLFRSASEGSATTSKDPLMKKGDETVKNSSFRRTDSGGLVVGSTSRRRKAAADEIHYTANRVVAEEMRRKTQLPYKSGLFGCLGFHNNGGSFHEISRGMAKKNFF